MTSTIDRGKTREGLDWGRAPPRTHPQADRRIELLVFMGLVAVAAVALWLLAGDDTTDCSFEIAEQMRFERIGQQAAVVDVEDFASLEDGVAATMDHSFDRAELERFSRIGGYAPAITLNEFAALEDHAFVAPTHGELQGLADIYTGDSFGSMPMDYWQNLALQELADIYTGDSFGSMPMDYWQAHTSPVE